MAPIVKNNIEHIKRLCKVHKVESISLFGSATTASFNNNRDLDFLVKFSSTINLLDYADNYFDFLEALKKIFNRNIDLVSKKSLKNPNLKKEIEATKIALYED